VSDIVGSQAAGMVPTCCPAALTPSLEMTQAPGWPGTPAVSISLGLALRLTVAPGAAIVVTVWLVGNRCGRIHSGVMNWTAAKMARVMAMAGIARRMTSPAVTPSAKPNAA
jgi:hypothetical protein